MFGFVSANYAELDKAAQKRYGAVYCGICRQIRLRCGKAARLVLSYDMAFLALLLMSLYEPEETQGKRACGLHPLHPRPWTDNEFIRYAADMNVALAYYKAMDDLADESKRSARLLAKHLAPAAQKLAAEYPRQCQAMESSIRQLRALEQENCDNPDLPAGCFGQLMAVLFDYKQDLWSDTLQSLGAALGRYIYLADAAVDYRRDSKKKQYNPFLAMATGEDWARWEEYLVLEMGCCTEHFERLPLVQDKDILDNILYSGIWLEYRRKQREQKASREDNYDR